MGIEVINIPTGCTYLCQPPLKSAMREMWEGWMMNGGIVEGKAKEPTRKQVAEWLVDVCTNIPEQVARNAWLKKGYAWF